MSSGIQLIPSSVDSMNTLSSMRRELTQYHRELETLNQDKDNFQKKYIRPDISSQLLATAKGLRRLKLLLSKLTHWAFSYEDKRAKKMLMRIEAQVDDVQLKIVRLRQDIMNHCLQNEIELPPFLTQIPVGFFDQGYILRLFQTLQATTSSVSGHLRGLNDNATVRESTGWHITTYLDQKTMTASYQVKTPIVGKDWRPKDVWNDLWELHANRVRFLELFGEVLCNYTLISRDNDVIVFRVNAIGTEILLYVCCYRMKVGDAYQIHFCILDHQLNSVGVVSTTHIQDVKSKKGHDVCFLMTMGTFQMMDMSNWDGIDAPQRADRLLAANAFGAVRWAKELPDEVVARHGTWYYHEMDAQGDMLRDQFPCKFQRSAQHQAGYEVYDDSL
ncbi:hypothetical protein THRCLA_08903 [Thraustotheca clavata]|uniref:Uncharacterized protein n=1 Tax=Thraustotheca clavata TaxID=74557 RepID=A0A1V9Z114_9STRA|nr:hypothetical protein THRCLA_08903 [Thraustotheca clavata]